MPFLRTVMEGAAVVGGVRHHPAGDRDRGRARSATPAILEFQKRSTEYPYTTLQ